MKNFIFKSQRLLMTGLMLLFAAGIWADNEFKVANDVFIEPGMTHEVQFVLNNTDPVAAMQANVVLPNGIVYVANSIKVNGERIDPDDHTVNFIKMSTGENGETTYRFSVLFSNVSNPLPIPGNEGVIATIEVIAAKTFNKKAFIELNTVVGTDVNVNKIDFANSSAAIMPLVAKIDVPEKEISMHRGSVARVDVELDNENVEISGIQADIVLPEGISVAQNEKGRLDFIRSERMPLGAQFSYAYDKDDNSRLRVIISSITGENIIGNAGTLFSFNITAQDLAEVSEARIEKVIVSDAANNAYALEDVVKITITNDSVTVLAPVMQRHEALQAALDEAVVRVNEYCVNTKDSVYVTGLQAAVQNDIDALELTIKAAFEDGTLAETGEELLSEAEPAIGDSIVAYETKAKAYEDMFINEVAYVRLSETFAALEKSLSDANDTISAKYPEAAAMEAIQAMQKDVADTIAAYKAEVEAQYAAVALNDESSVDSIGVENSIAALVAAAKEAQEAYENGAEANEAAYVRLSEVLAALEKSLSDANDTVSTKYPEAAAMESIQAMQKNVADTIAAYKAEVEALYAAVALNDESAVDSIGVENSIAALLAAAKEAQEAYENGAEANEAAYVRLSEVLAALEKSLSDANDTVSTKYPEAAAMESIQAMQKNVADTIAAYKVEVEAQYAAGVLNDESTVNAAGVEAAIEAMLAAAKEAQQANDDAIRKAANEAAYQRLNGEIATLQGRLDANRESILTNCPLVAADFIDKLDELQDEIDQLKSSVDAQYKAVELNDESTIETAALKAAISQVLKDALNAQQHVVGIETAKTDDSRIVKIYNVTGAEVKNMVKGQVYIVKYANGKTKKVFNK